MSTFTFHGPLWLYLAWCAGAFFASLILNSFIEYFVHSKVMHKLNPIVPYGYLHTTSHHAKFGHDASFETADPALKKHVLFTWKEYVLFPLFTLALYAPLELAIGRPILPGVLLAVLCGLQAFNSLHWRMHVPQDTWFQRSWAFRFLKNHHRLHHEDMKSNLNVVFPLADWVMGTLRR